MEKLLESLTRHEGRKNRLYLDTKNKLTGGIGHYFWPGSYLPDVAIDAIFAQDVRDARNSYLAIPTVFRNHLNADRAMVITELLFAMNLQKVLKFFKMWTAIERDDFEEAGNQLLDSDWARAVGLDPPSEKFPKGQRAYELAEILKKGVW